MGRWSLPPPTAAISSSCRLPAGSLRRPRLRARMRSRAARAGSPARRVKRTFQRRLLTACISPSCLTERSRSRKGAERERMPSLILIGPHILDAARHPARRDDRSGTRSHFLRLSGRCAPGPAGRRRSIGVGAGPGPAHLGPGMAPYGSLRQPSRCYPRITPSFPDLPPLNIDSVDRPLGRWNSNVPSTRCRTRNGINPRHRVRDALPSQSITGECQGGGPAKHGPYAAFPPCLPPARNEGGLLTARPYPGPVHPLFHPHHGFFFAFARRALSSSLFCVLVSGQVLE
jgi:hypothetical protein